MILDLVRLFTEPPPLYHFQESLKASLPICTVCWFYTAQAVSLMLPKPSLAEAYYSRSLAGYGNLPVFQFFDSSQCREIPLPQSGISAAEAIPGSAGWPCLASIYGHIPGRLIGTHPPL